jgi:DNA repair exonuclease SbcCD ATPase subunit
LPEIDKNILLAVNITQRNNPLLLTVDHPCYEKELRDIITELSKMLPILQSYLDRLGFLRYLRVSINTQKTSTYVQSLCDFSKLPNDDHFRSLGNNKICDERVFAVLATYVPLLIHGLTSHKSTYDSLSRKYTAYITNPNTPQRLLKQIVTLYDEKQKQEINYQQCSLTASQQSPEYQNGINEIKRINEEIATQKNSGQLERETNLRTIADQKSSIEQYLQEIEQLKQQLRLQ